MLNALAPTKSRGRSWVWASIVLAGGLPLAVQAQSGPEASKGTTPKASGGEATKKAEEAPAKGAETPEQPANEEKPVSVEVYEEPAAQAAIQNTFPQLTGRTLGQSQMKQVESMASSGTPDAELIQRYVTAQAAALTSHTNINALLDPAQFKPNSGAARGIREASANLLRPIELARKANNAAFLKTYTQAMVKEAPRLLSNHLFARLETIIALAQTGSPEALDTFIKQLTDENQSVWVKQWAARGITNLLQTPTGYRDDIPNTSSRTATSAAKALASLLSREDLPWPVQLRVLEALGALRQAADPTAQSKVEFASAALQVLSNAQMRPEVRAQAAWALGMMRVSAASGQFNYPLIAYYIGEVAADLGERIASTYDDNFTLAQYWASPLIYQVYASLNGQDGARDSGLLKMQLSPQHKKFVQEVADLVRPVTRASVDLFKAPKGTRDKMAKELSDRVGQLKAFLDKNPPAQKSLVPGGQPFPLQAQMAGAPGANQRVAGAAPGR